MGGRPTGGRHIGGRPIGGRLIGGRLIRGRPIGGSSRHTGGWHIALHTLGSGQHSPVSFGACCVL